MLTPLRGEGGAELTCPPSRSDKPHPEDPAPGPGLTLGLTEALSIPCALLWARPPATPQKLAQTAGRGELTWAGPGSAVWLGQATAKVPSAAPGSWEGKLPAGPSVDWRRPPERAGGGWEAGRGRCRRGMRQKTGMSRPHWQGGQWGAGGHHRARAQGDRRRPPKGHLLPLPGPGTVRGQPSGNAPHRQHPQKSRWHGSARQPGPRRGSLPGC